MLEHLGEEREDDRKPHQVNEDGEEDDQEAGLGSGGGWSVGLSVHGAHHTLRRAEFGSGECLLAFVCGMTALFGPRRASNGPPIG